MTKEKLQDIFRDLFEEEDLIIEDSTSAQDIEDWDSLMHIQLIAQVQEDFGIRFTTAEIMKLKNVGEFVSLIEMKVNQ